MTNETLYLELASKGQTLTASLSGEIDHHSARGAREKLDTALFKHRPEELVLDLFNVNFMDSAGLGLILGRVALCEELGIRVRLLRLSPRVRKILAIAGLERIRSITIE